MTGKKLWNKNYILVLTVCALAAFTHNAFTTMFPIYVLDIGGSNKDTGLMMAALTVAGMVTRLFAGRLIDSWGRKKTFVLGSILFTLNTLGYCFVTNMTGIYILRFMNGVTQGIYFSPPATIIADNTPEDKLVDAMSYFGIASSIAIAIAPTAGSVIYASIGPVAFFAVSTVFAALSALCCLFIKETYHPEKKVPAQQLSIKKLASDTFEFTALLPAAISFFIMFGSSSVSNFLLPCGVERNISSISLYFTVNSVTVIILRLFMGRIAEKFSGRTLISVGLVLISAGIVIIAVANSLVLVLAASVLIAIGTTFATQLLQIQILSGAANSRRGAANATLAFFQDIGTGMGAAVWGGITDIGYGVVYGLSAMVTMLGLGVHAVGNRKKNNGVN